MPGVRDRVGGVEWRRGEGFWGFGKEQRERARRAGGVRGVKGEV